MLSNLMRSKLSALLVLGTIAFYTIFLQSCKKDEESHPEIQTVTAIALSPVKVVLKANVANKGSFEILDHGFLYSTWNNVSEGNGTKVSLGKSISEGEISKEITNLGYLGSSTLYARAYLTNSNGTVYGQVVSVQLPTVGTGSIVPSVAKAGEQVVLNGQFHSLTKDEVSVTFGGVHAKIIEVTPIKITVEVPAGINLNTYYSNYNNVGIQLIIGGNTQTLSANFKLSPTLTSFSPASGVIGSNITINGSNIGSYYSYNSLKVYFGSVLSPSVSSNSGYITATVPILNDPKATVYVEVDGNKQAVPGEFSLTTPTITSITPTSGLPTALLTIYGSNFPLNYYYNNSLTVTVGGLVAGVTYYSNGQLNVTIPSGLSTGDHKVVLKTGPFTVEAPQLLKVQSMAATSFSPSSGAVGKEVTIQGNFVPNASYQVLFGTIPSNAYSVSATSLKAQVPYGATPGDVKISVQKDNQKSEASGLFTVLAPTLTSFTPSSGVAGTAVTIKGTGFNTYLYNNSVRFGSTTATVLSATENTIIAIVPSNLNPGAMKISVITNGQTVTSTSNFTVE
jgi:hypothetical protein